ncbi:MAG TPA: SPASM domain-containing protein [bacterium]|nr:SPASM domain-containing protein [bacterium]
MQWSWSRYNILGGGCLCNLRTGIIVEPEPGEIDFGGSADAVRLELLEELAGDGFVVEDVGEEKNIALAQIKARARNDKYLIILLAPTMECNNHCPYCYEPYGVRCGKPMSGENIDLFCKALDECLQKNSFEVLSLEFIGGEPMLGWGVIKKLLPRVKAICQKYDVKLEIEMTSNGQLLTPAKAEFLSQFNWKHLQVTFEGPPEVHDRIRLTKTGQPTFAKIMANLTTMIKAGCAPTEITARVHVDTDNPSATKRLLRIFTEQGLSSYGGFRTRLAFVNASLPNEAEVQPYYAYEKAQILLQLFRFMKELEINGAPEIYSFGPVCYKRRRWSFIVGPDGSLYDCESLLGQTEYATGHVRDGLIGKNSDAYFDRLPEKCRECQFLPVCAGACPYYSQVKPDSPCPREFLALIQSELLTINN